MSSPIECAGKLAQTGPVSTAAQAGLPGEDIDEKPVEPFTDTVTGGRNLDIVLVDFEDNDPENPMNWSSMRKWLMVLVVSWMGFVSVFATMTIVPTAPQVLEEFHSHSALDRTLLVTIWEFGEGIGPFFIAPLSERFGRLPVFHIGNLLALCCLIASALSVDIAMLIVFRFLCGSCLSILTLGPAIIGDLFGVEQHGIAMALVMGTQMIGDFISPLAGSYIAQALSWRWAIWLAGIVLGFFSLLLLAVLRETYPVTILKRKATRLGRQNTDREYQSKHHSNVTTATILHDITRPIQIFARSPIVMLITVYMALVYSLLSLIFATLTEVMESTYPSTFSRGSIGLVFLSLAIGNTVAILFYTLTSDRYIAHKKKINGDAVKAESRLVHLLGAAVFLPLGLILYGWTLAFHVQYIVPLVGAGVAGFSVMLSALPIETYLVDVYDIYGASAIAAGVILRAISGALFPLVGPPLYNGIGLGWGNSVLALIAAVFILPLGLLMRYGDWFRSKEKPRASEA